MEWLPRLRLEVENVALPEEFRAWVPSVVVPSLKLTPPVGMAVPGELAATVAVKVTFWLCFTGLRDETTAMVVPSLFTTCVMAAEVLGLKPELPL